MSSNINEGLHKKNRNIIRVISFTASCGMAELEWDPSSIQRALYQTRAATLQHWEQGTFSRRTPFVSAWRCVPYYAEWFIVSNRMLLYLDNISGKDNEVRHAIIHVIAYKLWKESQLRSDNTSHQLPSTVNKTIDERWDTTCFFFPYSNIHDV